MLVLALTELLNGRAGGGGAYVASAGNSADTLMLAEVAGLFAVWEQALLTAAGEQPGGALRYTSSAGTTIRWRMGQYFAALDALFLLDQDAARGPGAWRVRPVAVGSVANALPAVRLDKEAAIPAAGGAGAGHAAACARALSVKL